MREVFISYKSNDPVLGNNDETLANELCEAIDVTCITCWTVGLCPALLLFQSR